MRLLKLSNSFRLLKILNDKNYFLSPKLTLDLINLSLKYNLSPYLFVDNFRDFYNYFNRMYDIFGDQLYIDDLLNLLANKENWEFLNEMENKR